MNGVGRDDTELNYTRGVSRVHESFSLMRVHEETLTKQFHIIIHLLMYCPADSCSVRGVSLLFAVVYLEDESGLTLLSSFRRRSEAFLGHTQSLMLFRTHIDALR